MAIGSDGRQSNGRFARGNPGGPGGDHVSTKRSIEFKEAYQNAITPKDMRKVALMVLKIALESEDETHRLAAASELTNRLMGRPVEMQSGDIHNQYPILVTATAAALELLEARQSLGDDPMRGIRQLCKGDDPPVPPTTDGKG